MVGKREVSDIVGLYPAREHFDAKCVIGNTYFVRGVRMQEAPDIIS